MSINIIIEPGVQVSLDDFCRNTRRHSIAVDGYVPSPPVYVEATGHQVFDHHHGVVRPATLCSAWQAVIAVRRFLFDEFRDEFGPDADVYLNDIDPDSATAGIVLKHWHHALATTNPILNRMLDVTHHLDMSGGLWPYPLDQNTLLELNEVHAEYWRMRLSGELDEKNAHAYLLAWQDAEIKFMELLNGRGRKRALNADFERLGGGDQWHLVREKGPQARIRMAHLGYRAIVSVRNAPNGKFIYTILRASEYLSGFPIQLICDRLNVDEPPEARFGGGDTVIGNARGPGSERSPKDMERFINAILAERHAV